MLAVSRGDPECFCVRRCGPRRSRSPAVPAECADAPRSRAFSSRLRDLGNQLFILVAVSFPFLLICVVVWASGREGVGSFLLELLACAAILVALVALLRFRVLSRCLGWSAGAFASLSRCLRRIEEAMRP